MHSKPEGWWTYPFMVVVRGENLGMRLAGTAASSQLVGETDWQIQRQLLLDFCYITYSKQLLPRAGKSG